MLPVQRRKRIVVGSSHSDGAEAAELRAPVVQVGTPEAGAARVARQHSAPAPLQLSILAHSLSLEEDSNMEGHVWEGWWARGAKE